MSLFTSLKNRLRKNLIKNEGGQGTTEYIMLVVVVIALIVIVGPRIKAKISEKMGQVETGMDEVNTH